MICKKATRFVPLAVIAAFTVACGEGEQQPLDTAEAVHEAQANIMEEVTERVEGPHEDELRRAAEAHRERAEVLEERPGEVAAVPVIVDKENDSGVEGTAWKFEEKDGNARR